MSLISFVNLSFLFIGAIFDIAIVPCKEDERAASASATYNDQQVEHAVKAGQVLPGYKPPPCHQPDNSQGYIDKEQLQRLMYCTCSATAAAAAAWSAYYCSHCWLAGGQPNYTMID
jgi:hypothetical protein